MTRPGRSAVERLSAIGTVLTVPGVVVLIIVVSFGWRAWTTKGPMAYGSRYVIQKDCKHVLPGIPEYFIVGSGGLSLPVKTVDQAKDRLICEWISDDEDMPGALRIDLQTFPRRLTSSAGGVAHEAFARRRAEIRGPMVPAARIGDETVFAAGTGPADPRRPRSATILARHGNTILRVDIRTADREDEAVKVRARTAAAIAFGSAEPEDTP